MEQKRIPLHSSAQKGLRHTHTVSRPPVLFLSTCRLNGASAQGGGTDGRVRRKPKKCAKTSVHTSKTRTMGEKNYGFPLAFSLFPFFILREKRWRDSSS